MADLIATPGWDNIPRLESSTAALGGPGGPMNEQAQALLNRTEQLRDDVDGLLMGLDQVDNTSDADKPISTLTQNALDAKAPINSPVFTGTVSGITKSMIGLGSVDNTSDLGKPISTATQTALNLKAPLDNPNFTGTVSGITKSMVGLGSVDNTSDVAKPVSTPTQAALNAKANKAGDTFSGNITIQPSADAALFLAAATTATTAYVNFRQAGLPKWYLVTRAAPGDLSFDRYNDAGTYAGTHIRLQRSDGSVYLNESGGNTFVSGTVVANQFNGSGAGLTGTAGSLTSGNSNAVSGVSGWSYSDWGNNPTYIWCTEGSSGQQHLTRPQYLSVAWAGSVGTVNGATGGTINGVVDAASSFRCRQGANGAVGGNVFNWHWDGSGHLYAFVDTTNVGWPTLNSDERIKKDIEPLESDTNAFLQIDIIKYRYRDIGIFKDDGEDRWGFSAQNLTQVMPRAVQGSVTAMQEDGVTPQPASIDLTPILAVTVQQVQNLINEVTALRAEVDALKAAAQPT